MNVTTCKSHVAALPEVSSHWGHNKRKISAAGCALLAPLLCSYMAGIWSCFCAWNLNSCPWIKWLWNTIWEECSSEHWKYCHFPVCNVHSSTMQWPCMSVQGVHVETDNRGRVSLYIWIQEPSKNSWLTPALHCKVCQYELRATLSFKAFHHLASGSAAIHL